MSYCSTCKRVVPDKKRRSDRKTCVACLRSSAARSQRYRTQGRTGGKKCEKGTRRYCSSCKCTKHAAHFIGKKKSCIQCLTKRRLANRAKRGNSWQGDSSLESPLQELLTNIMPRESFKVATDDWMQTLMHGATCQLLFERSRTPYTRKDNGLLQ